MDSIKNFLIDDSDDDELPVFDDNLVIPINVKINDDNDNFIDTPLDKPKEEDDITKKEENKINEVEEDNDEEDNDEEDNDEEEEDEFLEDDFEYIEDEDDTSENN
jgi:hypothetical protein